MSGQPRFGFVRSHVIPCGGLAMRHVYLGKDEGNRPNPMDFKDCMDLGVMQMLITTVPQKTWQNDLIFIFICFEIPGLLYLSIVLLYELHDGCAVLEYFGCFLEPISSVTRESDGQYKPIE